MLNVLFQTFYRQCVLDRTPRSISTTTVSSTTSGNSTHFENISALPTESGIDSPSLSGNYQALALQDEDVSVSCGRPVSYIPDHILPILWRIIYWTSQVLTWYHCLCLDHFSFLGFLTERFFLFCFVLFLVYWIKLIRLFDSRRPHPRPPLSALQQL